MTSNWQDQELKIINIEEAAGINMMVHGKCICTGNCVVAEVDRFQMERKLLLMAHVVRITQLQWIIAEARNLEEASIYSGMWQLATSYCWGEFFFSLCQSNQLVEELSGKDTGKRSQRPVIKKSHQKWDFTESWQSPAIKLQ